MIWTPTGRPESLNPTGATVAGKITDIINDGRQVKKILNLIKYFSPTIYAALFPKLGT